MPSQECHAASFRANAKCTYNYCNLFAVVKHMTVNKRMSLQVNAFTALLFMVVLYAYGLIEGRMLDKIWRKFYL